MFLNRSFLNVQMFSPKEQPSLFFQCKKTRRQNIAVYREQNHATLSLQQSSRNPRFRKAVAKSPQRYSYVRKDANEH
jgi:hypothetical protein